jgi:hypothetical protein
MCGIILEKKNLRVSWWNNLEEKEIHVIVFGWHNFEEKQPNSIWVEQF